MRSGGNLIGLWYKASVNPDEHVLWEDVFSIGGGVDFFFSDTPIKAMQARDKIQSN